MPKESITESFEMAPLGISEIRIFRPNRRMDARGWVAPSFSAGMFRDAGISFSIEHENVCWTPRVGTIRGFHYQLPPYAQPKLIQVIRGRILDVNVDLRKGSPTFGQHVKAELDADSWNQILVPAGFAHCYCTLTDDVRTVFKLGCEYAPKYARGFAWNDDDLEIEWPLSEENAIVLPRDLQRPRFRDLTEFFPYPATPDND